MSISVLEKNLQAIRIKNPSLAKKLLTAKANNAYAGIKSSKTNKPISIFENGHLMYSEYNPEKEVERLFSSDEEFVLFLGIGSALQIQYFLKTFPHKNCAISEASLEAFKSLLLIIDLSELFSNKAIRILSPILDTDFSKDLAENYVPILDGKLSVISLRSWETFYSQKLNTFKIKLKSSLKLIESDYLTQSTFGKVWLKNILQNLRLLSTFKPRLTKADIRKTALICGAGPSLSEKLKYIKDNRSRFIIFASDTAFLPLLRSGISPEFFLSVDPQIFSLEHFSLSSPKTTVAIFDLCALSGLSRAFLENGNNVMFTASFHPLLQYAMQFSPLAFANSSSGTVSMYALDVAYRLGFKNFETAGLDFAYTKGKAYANGTYFDEQSAGSSNRLFPRESFFTKLIFRSAVEKKFDGEKMTYTNEILNQYKAAYMNYKFDGKKWNSNTFQKFPYDEFLRQLLKDMENKSQNAYIAMLPFFAYCKKHNKNYDTALAIKTVLKYNVAYE